jgi:hypothetical protein
MLHLLPAGARADTANGWLAERTAVDVDGVYLRHLAAAGHVGALVRPDHYLLGRRQPWASWPASSTTCAATSAVFCAPQAKPT